MVEVRQAPAQQAALGWPPVRPPGRRLTRLLASLVRHPALADHLWPAADRRLVVADHPASGRQELPRVVLLSCRRSRWAGLC